MNNSEGEQQSGRMPLRVVILLHIGYWLMYLLLLMLILRVGMRTAGPVNVLKPLLSWPGFMLTVPSVLAFYLQYALLVPLLLAKKRFAAFGIMVLAGALVASFACVAIVALVAVISHFSTFQGNVFSSLQSAAGLTAVLALLALIHMIIATVMRGFISWYDDIAVKQELTRKTVEVEEALIRAKLDPHFLFNTLNNVDTLILRDAQAASKYLNKLSEILRFVLYDAHAALVPLEAELEYVRKYVELQRIRFTNPDVVLFKVVGAPHRLFITPMLLIPFVENAFKHAAGQRDDNSIVITATTAGNNLNFRCSNQYDPTRKDATQRGGLGLDLLRRRLSLLYHNLHELRITDVGDRYSVSLTIKLTDRALPDS
ncbi:MAG: sensor histidine kinase [Gemmatimonadaceae bacterium]